MNQPILSIVIANFNYGRFLPDALKSIVSQCEHPQVNTDMRVVLPIKGCEGAVEIIVCDGGSTDNSVEVIKMYADSIGWWVSERDKGQSDAFNKGFAHAKGSWITWLNADEMYMPGTFMAFYNMVIHTPKAEWITANDFKYNDETGIIENIGWGPHCHYGYLVRNRGPAAVFGPSAFIKRDTYLRMGEMDASLCYSMDYDYWCRLIMAGVAQYRLNRFCWADRIQSNSKTFGNKTVESEARKVVELARVAERNDYTYKFSFSNIWYCIWLLLRIIDGSMIRRFWLKWRYEGADKNLLLQCV